MRLSIIQAVSENQASVSGPQEVVVLVALQDPLVHLDLLALLDPSVPLAQAQVEIQDHSTLRVPVVDLLQEDSLAGEALQALLALQAPQALPVQAPEVSSHNQDSHQQCKASRPRHVGGFLLQRGLQELRVLSRSESGCGHLKVGVESQACHGLSVA